MTIIVTLPVDDGIVFVADTRVTHKDGSFTDGREKLRKPTTHCIVTSYGYAALADTPNGSGGCTLDMGTELEDILRERHERSPGAILTNNEEIAKELVERVAETLSGVGLGPEPLAAYFNAYEYSPVLKQWTGSFFKINLVPGTPANIDYDAINLWERPFNYRIRGDNGVLIQQGAFQYAGLLDNDKFRRINSGKILSVEDSFQLAYDILRTAFIERGARVSSTIEAVFLGEEGWRIEKQLGTDLLESSTS